MQTRLSIASTILFWAVALSIPLSAQTLPVFYSMNPPHVYVGTPTAVTITGTNFRSGMILAINSHFFPVKVINQYKGTAVVSGDIVSAPAFYRIYLLNKQGTVGPGEQYMEVCARIQAQPADLNLVVGQPVNFQLKFTGGCVH